MSGGSSHGRKGPGNGSSCCQCSGGPYLREIIPKCIEFGCNHTLCDYCPQVHIPPTKPPKSKQQKRKADRPKCPRQRRVAALSFASTEYSGALPSLTPLVHYIHERGIDYFAGSNLPLVVEPPALVGGVPQPCDGEDVWTCCGCGHSGCLVSTTPSCIDCGHPRCSSCDITEL
ncbi:hypothetical protein EJ08DRAFT_185863 [Tothia fuscella]|uniref:Uncharacterized protein n=1 Tax=Tothia fuscella TaxID=1048955 RepID=A0A9P4TZ67_9PEZI|nr:hypothetical protein EJ08DRAFT_185863 [Tothia fuscella]